MPLSLVFSFFFTPPATTEIYTLSLHDAFRSLLRSVPRSGGISAQVGRSARLSDGSRQRRGSNARSARRHRGGRRRRDGQTRDRKSTRLNSSHPSISYAVFCMQKTNTLHCTRQ